MEHVMEGEGQGEESGVALVVSTCPQLVTLLTLLLNLDPTLEEER
jgi:hypothetical protein